MATLCEYFSLFGWGTTVSLGATVAANRTIALNWTCEAMVNTNKVKQSCYRPGVAQRVPGS